MEMLEFEPQLQQLLRNRAARRDAPPYCARRDEDVVGRLAAFFADKVPGARVSAASRMGGGASKEQFIFTLDQPDGASERYVLRMDPFEAITETDRRREYEILAAVRHVVPAPEPLWLDADGSHFGQPAAIMAFVKGVTKPRDAGLKVSGLGTLLGERLRSRLAVPFLDHLAALHAFDWRSADLPSFSAPDADPYQAARWTVNYWRQLLDIDRVEYPPIVTLAEQWLMDNLPPCDKLVMTHGDYRTGNYLFDEDSAEITTVLDWELARIGDPVEDIAWVLMRIFGTFQDGVFRASDLYGREEFIRAYERATATMIDRRKLHFYEVLSSYKCYVIVAASGVSVARAKHNHQDVLLTFLAGAGPLFTADLCRLLKEDIA